ncbi:MAG: NAD-dependent deacylase [Candidatus Zixiibacteriota bacterium]|nr:MAG: NAD-dependent deacylase [candidate division Zixibacteria bacterium]
MVSDIAEIMANCRRCVVLTGAGMSAESGVPTFRGKDGLWRKFRAEELATMEAFLDNSKIVWEWYNWRRDLMSKVQPNSGHHAIRELETLCDNFVLITQNVDNLHRVAGTQSILELHGNIHHNKCVDCNKPCESSLSIDPDNIPTCEHCGGKIRPDVVWFGEMLDPVVINQAFQESEQADIFFSVGTSAIIYPAASLPPLAKRSGATLVEVNVEETPISFLADFQVREKSGEFLPRLVAALKGKTEPG